MFESKLCLTVMYNRFRIILIAYQFRLTAVVRQYQELITIPYFAPAHQYAPLRRALGSRAITYPVVYSNLGTIAEPSVSLLAYYTDP